MAKLWYSGSTTLQVKRAKSLLHGFQVQGYDGLTINPYQGCHHRCAYCYATYEWSPEFYDKIYSKINAPEVLDQQLARWKSQKIRPVMVSSATDCYQPAELKFGLTRRCIQVLQKYGVPYYVFTKSALIERDLELHRSYRDRCLLVWSITTCNEGKRRVLEPGTPPASRLFAAIKKFLDAGVKCAVNVDPIIPLVTDGELDLAETVDRCSSAGLANVFGSAMRLRADILDRMKNVFELLGIEDAIEKYKEIYGFEEPLRDKYLTVSDSYSERVQGLLERLLAAKGISDSFPDHLHEMSIKKTHSGQQSLLDFAQLPSLHAQ